ncbi:MAG: DUF1565 domain-containing protein [Proteobacteria bacterium]|nr:DUF1565 domain-containing protein [Pseudomonadota bacterium]
MRVPLFISALLGAWLLLPFSALAAEFHVSSVIGNDENHGTPEAPLQSIEKALKLAKVGDTIRVAQGTYAEQGCIEVPFPVTLLGGYDSDFQTRDIRKFRTLLQPTNDTAKTARKPLMTLKKSAPGQHFTVDGFIFDMGLRNSYSDAPESGDTPTGALLLPPAFNKKNDKNPTVTAQCLFIENPASPGDVTVQNNLFANCAQFGIQGGHKQGTFRVRNNVFVANRMAAIEIFGTGGKKGPKGPISSDGEVEIAYNTIAFTFGRLADMKDMGFGIRVMTMLQYHIHHNIIAFGTLTGLDHTRFNPGDWIRIEKNAVFGHREGDLLFAEAGNVEMARIATTGFKNLELAASQGNSSAKIVLPVSVTYLQAFLGATFRDSADMVSGSDANTVRRTYQLPQVNEPTPAPHLYGNRYTIDDALRLFGAHKSVGAKAPK